MEEQIVFFEWRGIKVQTRAHVPFNAHFEVYGEDMFHIEVRSVEPANAPLPITKTGYRSIWLTESQLDHFGGALAYVTGYLEEEAAKPEWKAKELAARQYSLF